jgi:hypothetical protein
VISLAAERFSPSPFPNSPFFSSNRSGGPSTSRPFQGLDDHRIFLDLVALEERLVAVHPLP